LHQFQLGVTKSCLVYAGLAIIVNFAYLLYASTAQPSLMLAF